MLASRKQNWVPRGRSMRTLYDCVEIVLILNPLTAGAAYIRVSELRTQNSESFIRLFNK